MRISCLMFAIFISNNVASTYLEVASMLHELSACRHSKPVDGIVY